MQALLASIGQQGSQIAQSNLEVSVALPQNVVLGRKEDDLSHQDFSLLRLRELTGAGCWIIERVRRRVMVMEVEGCHSISEKELL